MNDSSTFYSRYCGNVSKINHSSEFHNGYGGKFSKLIIVLNFLVDPAAMYQE